MSTPGDTLLLDRTAWDICLDASGDIALASAPYSGLQDASSAARTFAGEVYYDTTVGIPYFKDILGHTPPLALMKAEIVEAALTVPGITAASVYVSSIAGRTVRGQLHVTDETGATAITNF